MAKRPVVLFHEMLHRIVCAHGMVGDRAETARTAIGRYVRVLKRPAGLGTGAVRMDRNMVDVELVELEDKLRQWKPLGSEIALVCDAALAVVRRERVENLCDRCIADIAPQLESLRSSPNQGLLAK